MQASLMSVSVKIVEQILLETMLRHRENKEVTAGNQHGFNEGKSFLTNLVTFYSGNTAVMGKKRARDVTFLTCAKHLTLCHMISLSLSWRVMDLTHGPLGGLGIVWMVTLRPAVNV